MTYRTLSKWFLLTAFVFGMTQVMAARLKDMAVVSGQRPNQLIGYGLVVGLDGTGDNSGSNPVTGQSVITMLNSLGVSVPAGINLQARNAAVVMVTAELAALARPGQSMDVTVSSLTNARSLRGGTLLMTPLKAANGLVYGQAQGSIVVPGASVSTSMARTTVNQLSAGRIPSGGMVEQAAPKQTWTPLWSSTSTKWITLKFNVRLRLFPEWLAKRMPSQLLMPELFQFASLFKDHNASM